MIRLASIAVLLVVATSFSQQRPLSPGERAAGWVSLLDDPAASWRGYRTHEFPASGWRHEGGVLTTHPAKGATDLVTHQEFGDFEIAFEWSVGPGGNSGVLYRVTETHDATWQSGPEYQVLDDVAHRFPPNGPHSAGALYDLVAPPADKPLRSVGSFNEGRIRLRRGRVEHWLNGARILAVTLGDEAWEVRVKTSKFRAYPGFARARRGRLALQHHGSSVSYRNVRVRRLDAPLPGETATVRDGAVRGLVADEATVASGSLRLRAGSSAAFERLPARFVLRFSWRGVKGSAGVVSLRGDDGGKGLLVHLRTDAHGTWRDAEIALDGETARVLIDGAPESDAVARGKVTPGPAIRCDRGAIEIDELSLAPIPDAGQTTSK